jgi:hypothetical protein
VDLFFWDRVYLSEFGSWSFIWRGLAFHGFMSWFAAVEAQVIVHVVLSFPRSKVSSLLEFPFALGGIDFHIWRFF